MVTSSAIPRKTVIAGDDAVVTVPDLLSAEECSAFVRLTEERGYEAAPITTHRGFVMRPDVRNNRRVMIDDPAFARNLYRRVAPFVRGSVGAFQAIGLNERFRFYRYDVGQYFKYHGDGAFVRSPDEQSFYTAMVYLNDDFEGGATEFIDGYSIEPRRGMLLLFEHSLIHQGAPVLRGRKYVLRTDVMYLR